MGLVTAGYLGALVQFGTSQPAAPIPEPVAALPQPKLDANAMQTTVQLPVAPIVIRPAARAGSSTRRPAAHRVDVKAAARATAELERELVRELDEQPAPAPTTIQSLPKPEAAGVGHMQPSRYDVQQALLAMRPRLEMCAAGRHGVVETRVGIAGTGHVTRALIQGDFAGTQEGSCMARALREAIFLPFGGPVVQVQFPFAL